MARAKQVRLINYHSSTATSVPVATDLEYGEIAVIHKDDKEAKLQIRVGNELVNFANSGVVTSAITAAKESVEGQVTALDNKVVAFSSTVVSNYATSAQTFNADTKVLADAKTYTDDLKATNNETYNGETLAGLKAEINNIKGDGTGSIGELKKRLDDAKNDIDELQGTVGDSTKGLVKGVADLSGSVVSDYATSAQTFNADTKVLADAKTYTDGEIKNIKGGDGTTTATLSSLKTDVDNHGTAISGITNGAKLNNFKAVEDEIKTSISSVYKIKGTKATYAELPVEENTVGDVYNVTDANGNTPAGTNYVCTATTGTRDEQWDALGGTIDLSTYATKAYVDNALTGGTNPITTRLTTAESNISKLQQSASTFDTDIKTIKGWKINDKFISGSPVLNGTDINVDETENAKTLKAAIEDAKTAGDGAMTYAKGVSGTVNSLSNTVSTNKTTIDAYTVNSIKISTNPVLTGENVLVGGEGTDKANTLNQAIAAAKKAGTDAMTYAKGVSGSVNTLSGSVDTINKTVTGLTSQLNTVSGVAITAIQTIEVKNTSTNKITATKNDTKVTFDFDNMVIDCGEF